MAVNIDFVTVGNFGNGGEPAGESYGGAGWDRQNCGAVAYTYKMGKFEVTAWQYTDFLNAVAKTDPYGLYHNFMWSYTKGCKIQRSGSSGSYTYSVASELANLPVNYVDWGNCARFANWLHNGQPTGAQDLSTTEDGSYYLNGATLETDLQAVTRKAGATYVIPSEDEWYKAAYHKNDGVTNHYFDFPTSSNTAPTYEAPPGTDMTNGSANWHYVKVGGNYIGRTEVGAYNTKIGGEYVSDSPYGTFDQAGNVAEWVEDIYGPYTNYHRGLRGGDFDNGTVGFLSAAWRNGAGVVTENYYTGFRVAYVPEPATICLLGLGGLFLRRRK
jgi:formylglycine-generating enzyme required for sulfatase activity